MNTIRGIFVALFLTVNCIVWCGLVHILIVLKILLPVRPWQDWCSQQVVKIAETWTWCNSVVTKFIIRTRWQVEGADDLRPECSYLVCANHLSSTDIVALQEVFNYRIPFLRFFIKDQLKYVPLLGPVWLALDFPMMKRHSPEYLQKHPEKREEDMATTRRVCARLRGKRISILNFMEGTRLTPAKHAKQASPFKNLLKPKIGGLSLVLENLGDQFHSLLDVTIFYKPGPIGLWAFMCGRVKEVTLRVRSVEIPSELRGDAHPDSTIDRETLRQWVQTLWEQKDQLLSELQAKA